MELTLTAFDRVCCFMCNFFSEILPENNRIERQAIPLEPPSDPSYNFAFRTPEYSRREMADSIGRVRGILQLEK